MSFSGAHELQLWPFQHETGLSFDVQPRYSIGTEEVEDTHFSRLFLFILDLFFSCFWFLSLGLVLVGTLKV